MATNTCPMIYGRYLPTQVLGSGTYGQVMQCTDTVTGTEVAVKIAHRDPAYRRSALNEICAMQLLSDDDDTLKMLTSFEENGHICIVSELLHKNLYEVLSARAFRPLSLVAIQKIAERVFRALARLHKNGYMHCDIKPENIMLRRPGTADDRESEEYETTCLIDFGAVRQFHENTYFDVQSLWYRAPEVLLGVLYTPAIDSWSVGCLLFELYTGKALFPGNNPQKQLANIVHTVGMPPLAMMKTGANAAKMQLPYFEREVGSEAALCCHITNCRREAPVPQSVDNYGEAILVNLLCQLLNPDPLKRLDCADALFHPFVAAPRQQGQLSSPTSNLCSRSNRRASGSENFLANPFFSGGLSPACDEAQAANSFEPFCASRYATGNGEKFPAAFVGNPPAVLVSTPLQPRPPSQAQTAASVISPPQVFVPPTVYANAPTAVVQPVPFQINPQPPPLPQPQQKYQLMQPQHAQVSMPHLCQPHQHSNVNQSPQNSLNFGEYAAGRFPQALLQMIPQFSAFEAPVHPSVLSFQAYAAQPLSCASADQRCGHNGATAYGVSVLNSGRGVVYASS